MLTKSRASMYTLDIETEQRDLIIQNLHSSRQAAITYLEQLGSGGLQGIKDRKLNVGEREVRAGVGELQGDGPDDLPSRSERMEYAWGWPKS